MIKTPRQTNDALHLTSSPIVGILFEKMQDYEGYMLDVSDAYVTIYRILGVYRMFVAFRKLAGTAQNTARKGKL